MIERIQTSIQDLSQDQLSNVIQAHFETRKQLLHDLSPEDIQLEIQTEALALKQVRARKTFLSLQLEIQQLQQQCLEKEQLYQNCKQELDQAKQDLSDLTRKLEVLHTLNLY